ncbi:MAG: hypothetical protein ACT4N2_07775 [Hyphomicrobium sp.]
MSRRFAIPALAIAFLLPAALPASAQDAYTTRIEPRPFYGATVTIESGVRVFRPLPTTRHVIVNPGGQTPLNLGYYDSRVVEHSTSTNYNYNSYAPQGGGGGVYPGIYGDRGHPKRFDRHPRKGGLPGSPHR